MRRLRDVWVSRGGRSPSTQGGDAGAGARESLSDAERAAIVRDMHACVEAHVGQTAAAAHAEALRATYLELSRSGRHEFLLLAGTELAVDQGRLTDFARAVLEAAPAEREAAADHLRGVLDSPWSHLLRQFNRLPNGTPFLLELRSDLLRLKRREPMLAPLDADLMRLLRSWFDIGFLELSRVTWNSPASLLERLARSEAVHTVVGWDDLKNRLDADRRFFACFHPRFPDMPLAFVEIALTRGIPREIAPVLDQGAPTVEPTAADTAVFYSISNVEHGLRGIPFGEFVIHGAMRELSTELPHLRTFATISPIPGFRRWLGDQHAEPWLTEGERRELVPLLAAFSEESLVGLLDRAWADDPEVAELVRRPLMRLCSTYLLSDGAGGAPTDPVLRFHLSNGAYLEEISWLADRSARAMAQSAGMMAHYVYDPERIDANHERFVRDHEVVASDAVRRLAHEARPPRRRHPAEDGAPQGRGTRMRRGLARRRARAT